MRRVFIATANVRETKAVFEYLTSLLPKNEMALLNVQDYTLPRHEFELQTDKGKVHVSVTQADETGGDEARDLLRRIVDRVNPDAIFFVGCAALLDEKQKPSENSVFLARRGYDSDKVELAGGQAWYDMEQYHANRQIRRIFNQLAGAGEFDPINLKTNRDFISGSAFFRDRKTERRKDLVNKYPADAVVLEMEAFAIYKEIFNLLSEGRQAPRVVVIKGISDLGDAEAQDDKERSQRIATQNAATVVGRFLLRVAG